MFVVAPGGLQDSCQDRIGWNIPSCLAYHKLQQKFSSTMAMGRTSMRSTRALNIRMSQIQIPSSEEVHVHLARKQPAFRTKQFSSASTLRQASSLRICTSALVDTFGKNRQALIHEAI